MYLLMLLLLYPALKMFCFEDKVYVKHIIVNYEYHSCDYLFGQGLTFKTIFVFTFNDHYM